MSMHVSTKTLFFLFFAVTASSEYIEKYLISITEIQTPIKKTSFPYVNATTNIIATQALSINKLRTIEFVCTKLEQKYLVFSRCATFF